MDNDIDNSDERTMQLVTRESRAATAADRYCRSYYCEGPRGRDVILFGPSAGRTHGETYQQLLQASQQGVAAVVAVVGESWVALECDHCKQSVEAVVRFRSHSDDEYGPCSYCKACLVQAAKVFESKP